jgi:hypothetical protein
MPPNGPTRQIAHPYLPGQVPYLRSPRQETKVFWFFSSEKNKNLLFLQKKPESSFSEEKEAKRL